MAASGYLLPVEEARKSRRGQYLFLNGRPVEDRVVWHALEEGFRGALPAGRHPVAWMWIEMDPHLVDVNVHPAKREVRFHRPAELRGLILEAVERALSVNREARGGRAPGQVAGPQIEGRWESEGERVQGAVEEEQGRAANRLPEGGDTAETMTRPRPQPQVWRTEVQRELEAEEGSRVETPSPAAPAFRVVGVLEGRYVVLEASDGLVLLEGEGARERILYEGFLAAAQSGGPESQGLLVPVLLELEARDADVVLRNADNFREAGMEVESFGGITVQLRSVPALLADANPKALLLDLVDEMVASAESRAGRTLAFEKFAGELAKVGARGERCRLESAQSLLNQLFTCDLPYCTPDGRPTLVQYSSTELRRKFGRSH